MRQNNASYGFLARQNLKVFSYVFFYNYSELESCLNIANIYFLMQIFIRLISEVNFNFHKNLRKTKGYNNYYFLLGALKNKYDIKKWNFGFYKRSRPMEIRTELFHF